MKIRLGNLQNGLHHEESVLGLCFREMIDAAPCRKFAGLARHVLTPLFQATARTTNTTVLLPLSLSVKKSTVNGA